MSGLCLTLEEKWDDDEVKLSRWNWVKGFGGGGLKVRKLLSQMEWISWVFYKLELSYGVQANH